ncbi:MAG: ABC transporter substrate-binding protein [Verrucomicrobiota bacterium]
MIYLRRVVLCVVPVLLVAGYGWAYLEVRDRGRVEDQLEIVFAVREGPDPVNPFAGGDWAAETMEDLFFNALLERDEAFRLQPALAKSWEPSQTAHYYFGSVAGAEAGEALLRERKSSWLEWGVADVMRERDEVRVRFRGHEVAAPERVYGLFDEETLAPVKLLRVRVFQNAVASYRDFIRGAVEASQVRREWFGDEPTYELALVGDADDFLREFRNYYEANPTLGASFRLEEEVPYLVEPELVFTLREGVFWHDGVPVTAADVLFSFGWSREQPWNREVRRAFATVLGVEALDDVRVRVVYRDLNALFLEAWANLPILPGHLLAGKGAETWGEGFGRAPVGTGPFRLEAWGEDGVTLTRNEEYYLGAPETERLRFDVMPDGVERRLRMIRGEVDSYLLEYPEGELLERDERFEIYPTRPAEEAVLFWNTALAPSDAVAVRRAIGQAIDGEALASAVGGRGVAFRGIFHPQSEYAEGEGGGMGFDLEAARAGLEEAGWRRGGEGEGAIEDEDGGDLVLRVAVLDEGDFEATAFVRESLRDLGVRLEVEVVDEEEMAAGDLFRSEFHGVVFTHRPSSDWADFRASDLGQLLGRAMQDYSREEGGLHEAWEAVGRARSDEERLAASEAVLDSLEEEQVFAVLYGRPANRVLRRGEMGISRAAGEGRRVKRLLGEGEAGVDESVAWWIKDAGERGEVR